TPDLLDWLITAGQVDTDLDAEWDIAAPVSEEALINAAWDLNRDDGVALAAVISLLVMCAARLWPLQHQLKYASDWPLARHGGRRRLAVDQFIRDMRTRVHEGETVAETGRWF